MIMVQPHSQSAISAPVSPDGSLSETPHRSNTVPKWDNSRDEWLSDEPELESDFHRDQIDLLLRLMRWYWRNRNDVYFSGNTTVYYDPNQRTNRNFRGPDIYVVFGAEKRLRNSWTVWREGGKYPDVVFELLSNSTAKMDRTTKKELYQNEWKLPNYFWFHPETEEFQGFTLVDGQYQEIQPNAQGQLWSAQMQLFVGVHNGDMLRFFSAAGELILSEEEEERSLKESAQQKLDEERSLKQVTQQQLEEERSLKDAALQRAEQLAERLRKMGLDPDDF